MTAQGVLDPIPIPVLLVLFVAAAAAVYEIGFRVGRWAQDRVPSDSAGHSGVIIGSLLALLAFLIAVTMGMAADRYDARRALVLDEANAIHTTYLRAGFLPATERDEVRDLLRAYVPLRINVADRAALEAQFVESEKIHAQLWAITEATQKNSETFSLFADSLNDVIDLHETRVAAIVYGRVPETVVLVLLIGSVLSIAAIGYGSGLTGHRSPVGAGVLIVVLAVVLVIMIDLDRPRDGFLQVSQQPLIDLQQELGPPIAP